MPWLHVKKNNFEIISVFYFTCYHVWNWNNIVSAAAGVLKSIENYFSDNEHVGKYSWAAISLWNEFRQNYFRRMSMKAEIIVINTVTDILATVTSHCHIVVLYRCCGFFI